MKIGLVELGRMGSTMAQRLFERFSSRPQDPFSHRTIAALRNQLGGHPTKGA
ncbi:MAG: hypothetical protein LJF04_00305 [Gemmatimonadetes bacterium]|nr:hypothetical protein [Gemmatimonadota bacterium]